MNGPHIELTELKVHSLVCREPNCNYTVWVTNMTIVYDLFTDHRLFHIQTEPWKFHFLSNPGPYTWQICDSCNYNRHYCFFCGENITHAEEFNQTHPCYAELVNSE